MLEKNDANRKCFDNRRPCAKYRLVHLARVAKASVRRQDLPLGGDLIHFWFEVEGQRLIYSYINKNACSAFKSVISRTSPYYENSLGVAEEISFLLKHHAIRFRRQLDEADIAIFVYRDPMDRFVSTIINKFVMRSGSKDLEANVVALAGVEASSLTISGLLKLYLLPNLHKRNRHLSPVIDQHFFTQSQCLAPIVYDFAIPINHLHQSMTMLIGPDLSDQFFSRPTNPSFAEMYDDNVSDVTFKEMRRRFELQKSVPSACAILTSEVRSTLLRLYDEDFRMIKMLNG